MQFTNPNDPLFNKQWSLVSVLKFEHVSVYYAFSIVGVM